ncbi:MAG TPA: hypothetical protein ENN31_01335 [Candidatus Vogelbacteria bacterium]|nr:hypothetical protein [Candidatus Vogelbacteria bacterium]
MAQKPTISIIACLGKENRAIGKNNKLLWDIPEDLEHFKKITLHHPVIMGENTFFPLVDHYRKDLILLLANKKIFLKKKI